MSEQPERTRVSFNSDGVELVGYLYRPAHATGKVPCVVIGHGFSGTQDRLVASAERAPRGELRRYPGDHFDFYRDPLRQQVLADQIDFLRTHM